MRRSELQELLWGKAAYECGHQNTRRALSDIKSKLGEAFNSIFNITNDEVALNLDLVQWVGGPDDGAFLEDLDIPHQAFRDWVSQHRQRPVQQQTSQLPQQATQQRLKVAVLPLAPLGDDRELAAVGDWISQHCGRMLARSKLLTAISHLSSRAVSQNSGNIEAIRRALKVDYVLCGTVQRSGAGVLFDLEFVDAKNGAILWSLQLRCNSTKDIGDISEKLNTVTQQISLTIDQQISTALYSRPMAKIADHHLVIAGSSLMYRRNLRSFLSARTYLDEARARHGAAVEPLIWLAKWHVLNVMNGYSLNVEKDTVRAEELCNQALDLSPNCCLALTIEGFVQNNLRGEINRAADCFDAAISICPDESLAWLLKGTQQAFADNGEGAITATQKARELSPLDPFGYYYDSLASTAHLAASDFVAALELANKSLARNARHASTHRAKITALHNLGRRAEAKNAASALRNIDPNFGLDHYRKNFPVTRHRLGHLVIEALIASGIR